MRAIKIDEYGDENVLNIVEIDIPEPKPDELLVKVMSAGVNPMDWKIRDGAGARFGMTLPIYLGSEVAGIVEKVGDDIKDLKPGDEVFGTIKSGGYADYVLAKANEMVIKPRNIDFNEAASIPLGALTAWQALFDVAHLQQGQKVLITAAAGGVGSLAVQLAKAKGTYVIALASGQNEAFVKRLGADEFVDYQTCQFEDVIKDIDVAFDLVGSDTFERALKCIKKGGFLVTAVAFPPDDTVEKYGVNSARVFCKPDAKELLEISQLVDAGKLQPSVSAILSLEQIKQAHQLSKSGHTRGKIILQMSL